MKADFHAIDMETWPRAQTYSYFTETVSTLIYSINVTMDVTILRNTLKSKGLKFFPTYLYLVTGAIRSRREFLMAIQDDILGYWDYRTPFYPILHEDDKTITFLWCGSEAQNRADFERSRRIYCPNCLRFELTETGMLQQSEDDTNKRKVPESKGAFPFSPIKCPA